MSQTIRIKKGLDIRLVGEAEKVTTSVASKVYAVKPTDFHGVVPKMMVKPGENIKAGAPLFYSKEYPEIKFCSPVSGEIAEIRRGEKRRILEIVILADDKIEYEEFKPSEGSAEEIKEVLLNSGLWPFFKRRPYDVVAWPTDQPVNLFISGFDTEALTADQEFALRGEEKYFQKGLDILGKLINGPVYLGVHEKHNTEEIFRNATGVEIKTFSGPHPSGVVGIQINHVAPVNKGEVSWTIKPLGVVAIGKLFMEGKVDLSRTVAVGGSKINKPQYVKSMYGAQVKNLVVDNIDREDTRLISGGVLTGTQVSEDGFLGFYDNSLAAIPEGNQTEFFGWLLPGLDKLSLSKTFLSWLMPLKPYDLNTNLHGEHRAIVMAGEYDKVFPMDILPEHLIKSFITKDLEKMEQLGVYEVAPEDFALCEFVCTSKLNLQEIVRDSLDLAIEELG
ncbi:MAG TPA: NADH:ubiquinone reductase (Na(+)-transporting) subunit A [Flavobacteriales bacterium]|jgi:Na+-transporting NADH:ubiquinone oxidoreductase subunit A|nr:NADH:ubiquinone reductase (Na(+)-transporting) subunit A [Flavobacteriales bacterium]